MATNPPKRHEQTLPAPQQDRAVIQWLLDAGADPAIRRQVLGDLTGAPQEDIAAERARVATAGWGARLRALQGTGGAWGGTAWNQGGFHQARPDTVARAGARSGQRGAAAGGGPGPRARAVDGLGLGRHLAGGGLRGESLLRRRGRAMHQWAGGGQRRLLRLRRGPPAHYGPAACRAATGPLG